MGLGRVTKIRLFGTHVDISISIRKMIIEHHDQETRYLQDVLLAMDQNYNDSDYEARLDFQSTRDDVKNKVWVEAI